MNSSFEGILIPKFQVINCRQSWQLVNPTRFIIFKANIREHTHIKGGGTLDLISIGQGNYPRTKISFPLSFLSIVPLILFENSSCEKTQIFGHLQLASSVGIEVLFLSSQQFHLTQIHTKQYNYFSINKIIMVQMKKTIDGPQTSQSQQQQGGDGILSVLLRVYESLPLVSESGQQLQ